MPTADFEKLGSFYLGREYDLAAARRLDNLLLYDSKDLVTHAVCVGMTGSGKTGLCLGVIEEAAIDGVPAIVIDPKGDLANLLLTFPQLRAQDFEPWVNPDEARKRGLDLPAFAAQQAALWSKGLAEWGQDGARIQRLRDAADVVVYTPGSNAGIPISVLRSFAAPVGAEADDAELLAERVGSTVSGLLGLLGIDADPLTSREHILLSTILGHAWNAGHDLDLPGLIQAIQSPPVDRLGVMDLETVYPAKDRFALAMRLNNLIASPGFARWTEGEPLDIGAMLHAPSGKPRIAIVSIAHLSDAERMFFVSTLLTAVLGWTRRQSGTTSLRALIYMDEIAGYVPPVANPPSKQPLLTLMKQARAFGVGVMLATQNPVDLDYKGLANAGTWFIGRLQTDQDKQRVLDGLEGASATAGARFDRRAMDQLLSSLRTRVFLMHNVHEDAPVIFETRWAMSYLRGPLTRDQIRAAMAARPAPAVSAVAPSAAAAPAPAPGPSPVAASAAPASAVRPALPPEIPQYFLPLSPSAASPVEYRPMLLGIARVFFSDAKLGVDVEQAVSRLTPIGSGPVAVDWAGAVVTTVKETDLLDRPAPAATFAGLPPDAAKARAYIAWSKDFSDAITRTIKLELWRSPGLKLTSRADESEREFRARLQLLAREQRDAAADKLRAKYAPKLAALEDRIRRAQQQVEVQKDQARNAKLGTAVSIGTAVLGAFLGRKAASAGNVGRAASAARGLGRQSKESADVDRAEDNVEALRQQAAELEAQFNAEVQALGERTDPAAEPLERLALAPKRGGVDIRAVVLAWAPFAPDASGRASPAWPGGASSPAS